MLMLTIHLCRPYGFPPVLTHSNTSTLILQLRRSGPIYPQFLHYIAPPPQLAVPLKHSSTRPLCSLLLYPCDVLPANGVPRGHILLHALGEACRLAA